MEYDAETLEGFAGRLYAKSVGVAIVLTLIGFGIPSIAILGLNFALTTFTDVMATIARHPVTYHDWSGVFLVAGIVGFIGAGCGLVIGLAWGQSYRLEAQKVLCMVAQEKHLRFMASKMQ